MNENNITRFEVSNFKKFDHLVVENIGQVNLITGDNNVGKTTLLEALLCSKLNIVWIKYLHQILDNRKISFHLEDIRSVSPKFPLENFLTYIFKDLEEKLVCTYQLMSGQTKMLSLEYKQLKEITIDLMKQYRSDNYQVFNAPDWLFFYEDGKIKELEWLYCDDIRFPDGLYMPLISLSNSSDDYLERMIIEMNLDERKFIINSLKTWVPDIEDFDYAQVGKFKLVRIATSSNNKYNAITTFGDGVQFAFRYLVEIIYAASRGMREDRIMIDEIDTGLHYLKMKEVWKAIFWVSQQRGIQIFATTHSMDCIKAFAEAAEETEGWGEKIRLIELKEANVKGKNKMYVNTFTIENIEAGIESSYDMRGGRIYGQY